MTCSIEGCERHHYAFGLCHMHYRRQWRRIGPVQVARETQHACTVDACGCPTVARDMCSYHYNVWWRAKKKAMA